MNISLPAEQISFIDNLTSRYGFANRSELVRSVFRLLKHQPEILAKESILEFKSPPIRSRARIMKDFKETGLYNKGFLKDLEDGLKRSDYFTE